MSHGAGHAVKAPKAQPALLPGGGVSVLACFNCTGLFLSLYRGVDIIRAGSHRTSKATFAQCFGRNKALFIGDRD